MAGAYRARGSPAALRIVEILGMTQARQWGVCTMNEFRTFLGLKTFDSFEEWNSDPEIAVSCRIHDPAHMSGALTHTHTHYRLW